MIGNALPNQLQRYYIFMIYARYCTKKSPIAFENTKGDFVRILRKRTFSVLAVSGSSQGVLSVVAR